MSDIVWFNYPIPLQQVLKEYQTFPMQNSMIHAHRMLQDFPKQHPKYMDHAILHRKKPIW